jgi:hypothetical protein
VQLANKHNFSVQVFAALEYPNHSSMAYNARHDVWYQIMRHLFSTLNATEALTILAPDALLVAPTHSQHVSR